MTRKLVLMKHGVSFLVFLLLTTIVAFESKAAAGFSVNPSAVGNGYSGIVTLTITGLTNTETVVVQKYLDANTNGVIDAKDLLVQQVDLTEGTNFVIGGVTNLNVPGDLDAINTQITAKLNLNNGDFIQNIVGNYFFKLSSPVGHFGPITNNFSVTNLPYAQKFTGNVVNNSTNVPNAIVLLFPPPRPGHGPGNPVAGAVANNSGVYTIPVPPGTYAPVAFKHDFVSSLDSPPVLDLAASATVNTNLTFLAATQTISGTIVDASNNAIGVPGIFLPVQGNGMVAIAFTDTNGNFTANVIDGDWEVKPESSSPIIHGYVLGKDGTNVAAGATGVIFPMAKATAMFYGSVKDGSGNPFVGIDVYTRDNDNLFESDNYTDINGNYFAGVLAGTWGIEVDAQNLPDFAGYIFSQPDYLQYGGTNLTAGMAVHQDFTALLATNHITGNVQFNGTNLPSVQISGYANIGGKYYYAQTETDSNGDYSLAVANGNWSLSPSCNGGDGSLDGILGNGNYQCPDNQNVNILNGDGVANFTIYPFGTSFLIQPYRNSPTHFSFTIKGDAGVNYTVQVSTNLASTNWIDLTSPTLIGNAFYFEDTNATNGIRFYRLRKN